MPSEFAPHQVLRMCGRVMQQFLVDWEGTKIALVCLVGSVIQSIALLLLKLAYQSIHCPRGLTTRMLNTTRILRWQCDSKCCDVVVETCVPADSLFQGDDDALGV